MSNSKYVDVGWDEKDLVDSYYMQFCCKVSDVVNDARCALSLAEMKLFLRECKKLITEQLDKAESHQ